MTTFNTSLVYWQHIVTLYVELGVQDRKFALFMIWLKIWHLFTLACVMGHTTTLAVNTLMAGLGIYRIWMSA